MNPIQAISADDQKVVEFSENPGRRLRLQRQSRGIEIERIAAQLHLRVSAVEALEQDRYQDLPGPVFVAGYLRNYARLLGLDPEPLVAAYRGANPTAEAAALRVGPLPRQEIGSGHILVRLVSLGLLAAVVAMLVLWWQNRTEVLLSLTPGDAKGLPATAADRPLLDRAKEPPPPEGVASGPGLPLPLPSATSAGPASAPASPADPSRVLAPSAESPPPSDAAPDATKIGADAAPPGAVVNPAQLAVTFSGPSRISVHDATGAAVLSGQMHKGETRVLEGSPPYSFVIGNAKVVRITLGGRPVDLTGRYRGSTARFTFDPRSPE